MPQTFQKVIELIPSLNQFDGISNLTTSETVLVSAVADQQIKLYAFYGFSRYDMPLLISSFGQAQIQVAVKAYQPVILNFNNAPVIFPNNSPLGLVSDNYGLEFQWSIFYTQD